MRPTRVPSLQFLCPLWTTQELAQLTQRRAYTGHYRPRRWADDLIAEEEEGDVTPEHKSTARSSTSTIASTERKQPATSLFDELFPEEGHPRRKKQKSRKLEKLPAFDWRAGSRIHQPGASRLHAGTIGEAPKDSLAGLKKEPAFQSAQDMSNGSGPAVLLISSLSKNLDESDFVRLSPKAEHIEGWSNGLVKVIQARDTRTLAPLSFYYLLFTSAAVATAYRVNLIRLHNLSKTQSFITRSTMPLPNEPALKPGEDITSLLRSLTILPSTSRIFIRLLREPFTPFIRKLVEEGNHAAVKEQQGKGDALVLMSLDSGRFSEADIQEALVRSGRKRNLPWNLAGRERDIEKLNDEESGTEEHAEDLAEQGEDRRTRAWWRPSRFVLAMKDKHEARRFVREWHRLPLPFGKHPPLVTVETLW